MPFVWLSPREEDLIRGFYKEGVNVTTIAKATKRSRNTGQDQVYPVSLPRTLVGNSPCRLTGHVKTTVTLLGCSPTRVCYVWLLA